MHIHIKKNLTIKNRFDPITSIAKKKRCIVNCDARRNALRWLRAITLQDIIEIRAEKVADITRPDHTLLTTSAVCQPQSNSCYTLGRHRRTDSRYPEDCFQTTRFHLRPHPLQELFQRIGRWRLLAFGFAEASAGLLRRIFKIDPSSRGLVVDRFSFPHDPLLARQVKLECIINCLSRIDVAFQKTLAIAITLDLIDDRRNDRMLELCLNRWLNKCSTVRHGRLEFNKRRIIVKLLKFRV